MENDTDFSWFQFYSFVPNQFTKFSDEEIFGTIGVDIAFGHTLRVTISNEWHVSNLADHSNLFKCRITGPENLMNFGTGTGKVINDVPYIHLYHHTLSATKELILGSSNYRGSQWNLQGPKKLENICYAYFTSLDVITKPSDLKMIAMANDGKLQMIMDVSREVVEITVYRESTENRTATLQQLIDTTIIPNNHIWMHTHDTNGTIYYELCSPFIYRIGLQPDTILPFQGKQIDRIDNVMTTGYLVLGDATTKVGLLAPFDEEHTTHLFKIEPFYNLNGNMLKFWFDNGNTDLYSGRTVQRQRFNTE